MKSTMMSINLDLLSQITDEPQEDLRNLDDDLEGSKVTIETVTGKVFQSECFGGGVDRLSVITGYEDEEEVLIDNSESRIELRHSEYTKEVSVCDAVELIKNGMSHLYVVLKIKEQYYLHSHVMNKDTTSWEFNSLEELQQYLEENHKTYKIFKKI